MGTNIMLAGLALQVLALSIFICLAMLFIWNCWWQRHFDRIHTQLRADWRFRGFVIALASASICIMARSIFRIVDLSQGWRGKISENQILFIVLEGVNVTIACLGLNLFNPSFVFPNDCSWEWTGRKEPTYLSRSPSPKLLFTDSRSPSPKSMFTESIMSEK